MSQTNDVIFSLCSDEEGVRIAAGCADASIKLFNKTSGGIAPGPELKGHEHPVVGVCFVRDLIVSVDYESVVIIWKHDGSKYLAKSKSRIYSGKSNSISGWSEEGYGAVVGCSDGRLRKLTVKNDLSVNVEEFFAHNHGVLCIAGNNEYLLSAGIDHKIALWKLKDMEKLGEISQHTSQISDLAMTASNEFGLLSFASCSENKIIIMSKKDHEMDMPTEKIGELEFIKQEIETEKNIASLTWSKSGYLISAATKEGTVESFMPNKEGKFERVNNEKK